MTYWKWRIRKALGIDNPKAIPTDARIRDCGLRRWLFAKRRRYEPDAAISFTSGQGIAPGERLYDHIHGVFQVPKKMYHSDGQKEQWLCEQYRERPSRWESLKTRLAWYRKYATRLYVFKSDAAIVADMRNRGELE